jgi:hypothetical protein
MRGLMKKITTAPWVSVLSVSVVVAGCTPRTEVASTMTMQVEPTVWVGGSDPCTTTLYQYIVDNKIAEVRIRSGEPGTPKISFPFPPGWKNAGDRTPDWAYGAIVYDKAQNPEDPPYIVAIASKLTGDVDPAKILEYAPGQLNTLPDFKPLHQPEEDSLSGFAAIDYVGTYVRKGQPRVVGQQTIVVPGNDSLFVLQLNAEAPEAEKQSVIDAARFIAEHTKISAPS